MKREKSNNGYVFQSKQKQQKKIKKIKKIERK